MYRVTVMVLQGGTSTLIIDPPLEQEGRQSYFFSPHEGLQGLDENVIQQAFTQNFTSLVLFDYYFLI